MNYPFEMQNDYDQQLMGPYLPQFINRLPGNRNVNGTAEDLAEQASLNILENEGGSEDILESTDRKSLNMQQIHSIQY
jgi:hypothetical protein